MSLPPTVVGFRLSIGKFDLSLYSICAIDKSVIQTLLFAIVNCLDALNLCVNHQQQNLLIDMEFVLVGQI